MVNDKERQEIASELVTAFINYAGCETTDDVGAALLILMRTVGITVSAAIGKDAALAGIQAVSEYVESTTDSVELHATKLATH